MPSYDFYSTPFLHFDAWYAEALAIPGIKYPNALTLATLGNDGFPESRILLLKGVENGCYLFFTNYLSAKGHQIDRHPKAGITFFWEQLGYQIRILGTLKKISAEQSDHYFQSRPRVSQLGAWASFQSQPLDSRDTLESRVLHLEEKYSEDESVPRPPHWGGYALTPVEFEFWAEKPFRLHDRFKYIKIEEGWKKTRLYP